MQVHELTSTVRWITVGATNAFVMLADLQEFICGPSRITLVHQRRCNKHANNSLRLELRAHVALMLHISISWRIMHTCGHIRTTYLTYLDFNNLWEFRPESIHNATYTNKRWRWSIVINKRVRLSVLLLLCWDYCSQRRRVFDMVRPIRIEMFSHYDLTSRANVVNRYCYVRYLAQTCILKR